MLSDPEIVKDAHLYVSKEKAGDDIAPPSKQIDIAPCNHTNESVLIQDGGVSAERARKLTMGRTQRPLRTSKRLNAIQVTEQCDDEDGDCNNSEHYAPGHESQALDDIEGQVHNQVLKTSIYPNKWNVVYVIITDPRTKASGIELCIEFTLVRIDQPVLDNEELVREVSDCKTIDDAFSS
ncbi:hypothetical protein D1007_02406 [Hordeum vulgare]|nr:hypothetical protein D1007_02406 [Hordeum vulgare]